MGEALSSNWNYIRNEHTGCSLVVTSYNTGEHFGYVILQDFNHECKSGDTKRFHLVTACVFQRHEDLEHYYGIEDVIDCYSAVFHQSYGQRTYNQSLQKAAARCKEFDQKVAEQYFH